jgi:Domain of unknown function (DUF4190)
VWGLVLGILSIACLGLLAGIPGIIVSVSARRSIRASQGRIGGAGMATAGLILSIIGTAMTVLAIFAFAILAATNTSSSSTALIGGAAHWV